MAKNAPNVPASVLAIGTANPPNVFEQSSYPVYYFRMTNSEHMTELKEKFQRICGCVHVLNAGDNSGINKRHMYLNEDVLKANPNICGYWENSLNARQDIAIEEVPRLGKEAALKAIAEWGQPVSKITHLILTTTGGVDMPGADLRLTQLLGLNLNVKRVMMYYLACYGGGTALRVAKDLAENNRGARVLVVCSELTAFTFRGPGETDIKIDNLVGQALFGDGAAALIVGADPITGVERPWFEIHWTGSRILPDSSHAIQGHLREVGSTFQLSKEIPAIISRNVEGVLEEALQGAFGSLSSASEDHFVNGGKKQPIPEYNNLFWLVHPGGRAILDKVEAKLGLEPKNLRISRQMLDNYGNMSSASLLFVMDEMRRHSVEQKCRTTGEGREWGVLLGFGPGLTTETAVLKSLPLLHQE